MITGEATVFVVDDDASMRRALERLLRSAGWKVEAFASADEFLGRAPGAGAGCLILDVRMPGMSGPELHERMAERAISLPIVFLTGHGDVTTGVRAMKRGAVDFLLKPVDDRLLLRTVRHALERHAAQQASETKRLQIQARVARLSPRELEVMRHVICGALNKQIAAEMGITEKTVKVHRGAVMDKMAAGSVAELVRQCDIAGVKPR
jgi:two-component system, LuxR family, response regulator FixJ